MDTRVCKVCGVEKAFTQGVWVVNKRKPEGRVCLSCHAAKNRQQYAARYQLEYIREKERKRCRAIKQQARLNIILKAKLLHATNLWYSKNRATAISLAIAKRNAKIRRTPKWLTVAQSESMAAIYSMSKWLSEVVGRKYHVDHIIPLQGKLVSGLHVPWNLQVIPAANNLSKGNKYASMEAA